MSRFSSSLPTSPATANAEFLLSLSAPPDRSGPRTAPDEAELLIDPAFYSFLSGVTVVLVLVSFSYTLAYLTLSTVRRRQYRKYRQKRRKEEERHKLARTGTTTAAPAHLSLPTSAPAAPPRPPSPVFVAELRPFSPSFALSRALQSSPSFLSQRHSLPALFRPVASAFAAASASSPSQLPRLSLALTSPAAISQYLLSIVTPRASTRSTTSLRFSSFSSPAPSTNGASRASSRAHPPPTPTPRVDDPDRLRIPAADAVSSAGETAVLTAFQQDDLDAAQHEHNRGFLSFSLSTFLLTIALLWLSLLTLTLTLSTPSLASHWLLTWLTSDLVSSLWTLVSLLTSLSLFLVAPFAYLYYEAEGLVFFPLPAFTSSRHGSTEDEYSFLPRFIETVVVLSFFSVMLYGSFQLLHSIVYHLPLLALSWTSVLSSLWSLTSWGWSFSLSSLFSPALLSNVMHFVPGLLICLLQSHEGFSSLLSSAFSLRVPFYYRHHLQRQLDKVEVKLIHTRLLLTSEPSPSRRLLLARRVQALEAQVKLVDGELRPPLLSLSAFPLLRNVAWFALSLLCLLVIWHVMVRVMQREARLMMGAIDELIREDEEEGKVKGLLTLLLTLIVSALKFLLTQMKHAINTLLFTLGMIRRRDMVDRGDGVGVSALPSVSFALHVWSDVLRLFSSFLLGQNGFQRPLSALLFDLLVANFFCVSCTIGLYRTRLMAPYSPFSSFASTASAAFAQGDREDAAARIHELDADSSLDGEHGVQRSRLPPVLLRSSSAGSTSSSPSEPSSALYSAQFFVVNTTVLLLLTSSFPFALWILGLSSFDLPRFYPSASELSSGVFMNAYNLAFIGLSARQGAALWAKMLWFLVKTSYSSLYHLLTLLLPSLQPSLPSPDALAALPAALRAHPMVARLSYLTSWPGMYWAARAVCVPLLRLLWVLLLYVLRVLVVGLRLCAQSLYLRALQTIQQQLSQHPVPLVNRRTEDMEDGDDLHGPVRRSTSRLRAMDEERPIPPASSPTKADAAGVASLLEDEGKAGGRDPRSTPVTHSLSHPSSSPPPPRSFTPNTSHASVPSTIRLVAPRPLSLAAAASLEALQSEGGVYEVQSRPTMQPMLSRATSMDAPVPSSRSRQTSASSLPFSPALSPSVVHSPSLSSSPRSPHSLSPLSPSHPPVSPSSQGASQRRRRRRAAAAPQ